MQHSTHTPTPPRETVEVWNRCHGGHSGGETPGHIPNPEAKPSSADGTAPARVWESRTPPDPNPAAGAPTPGCPCSVFPGRLSVPVFHAGTQVEQELRGVVESTPGEERQGEAAVVG